MNNRSLKDRVNALITNQIKAQDLLYDELVFEPLMNGATSEEQANGFHEYTRRLSGFDARAYKKVVEHIIANASENEQLFSRMNEGFAACGEYITHRNNFSEKVKEIMEMDGSMTDKQNMIDSLDFTRTRAHNRVIAHFNEMNKYASDNQIPNPYLTGHEFDPKNLDDRETVAEILAKQAPILEITREYYIEVQDTLSIEDESDRIRKMNVSELSAYYGVNIADRLDELRKHISTQDLDRIVDNLSNNAKQLQV